jgi:6-phosphogluconolactonase (cycloisomerase 2 family)
MSMKLRVLLSSISLVMLASIALVGCGHYVCGTTFGSSSCTSSGGGLTGGGGGTITQSALVYFMVDGASQNQMAVEGLNVAGSQQFVPISNFASPTFTNPINRGLVTVAEKFLYMPLSDNTLYGYTIDAATGQITAVSSNPTVLGPSSIAADPKGAVLFVGSSAGISAFTIDPTLGTLTLTATASTGGIAPAQITTDGLGTYVYALSGSSIYAFSYTSAGTLTTVPLSPFNAQGMAQISGEFSGKYIIGITAEDGAGGGSIDNSIYVFGIGVGTGTLSGPTKTTTQFSPVYLAVSPNGPFVYTFNDLFQNGVTGTPQAMEGYTFSTTTLGSLTPLPTSPFTNFTMTIGKFDQSGQYLFTQGSVSGVGGSWVLGADTTVGGLTSTIPHLGAPSTSFAVTDVP